jgi:hypothetical protein
LTVDHTRLSASRREQGGSVGHGAAVTVEGSIWPWGPLALRAAGQSPLARLEDARQSTAEPVVRPGIDGSAVISVIGERAHRIGHDQAGRSGGCSVVIHTQQLQ